MTLLRLCRSAVPKLLRGGTCSRQPPRRSLRATSSPPHPLDGMTPQRWFRRSPRTGFYEFEPRGGDSFFSDALHNMAGEQVAKAHVERATASRRGEGAARPMLPEEVATLAALTAHSLDVAPELQVTCRISSDKKINWIDISGATDRELSGEAWSLALRRYLLALGVPNDGMALPSSYLLLPHTSVVDGCHTLLLRYATRVPPPVGQHSIQSLTNRVAIFVLHTEISSPPDGISAVAPRDEGAAASGGPPARTLFITAHRCHCLCVDELHDHWEQHMAAQCALGDLLYFFVKRVLGSFTTNMWRCLIDFDGYETCVFSDGIDRENISRKIYDIKRRVAVYERCLSLTQDAYAHIVAALPAYFKDRRYRELQHRLVNAESLARDLSADAESALELIFQLSSYEVNELMRFLTLFSAFFIPLNFISSVYGMNIDGLPFTQSDHGGIYLSGLFALGIAVLLSWFRRKKFV